MRSLWMWWKIDKALHEDLWTQWNTDVVDNGVSRDVV